MLLRIIFYYAPVWCVYLYSSTQLHVLMVTQQADNSHRPNTILSHRNRDNQSPRRVQTEHWRSYRPDLWQFHHQRHNSRGSEFPNKTTFHPRIYYNKRWHGTKYIPTSTSIQKIHDNVSNPKTETCVAEAIRDHAVAFLPCHVSNLDCTYHQPYIGIRES